ncbi:nitrite reductase small subunit NirD [Gordonia sp. (in: high G+C Gram-positive bacteria)]|uniref:nitrite reductase small subunit NirD n=1 Tax=Gordonia sp. (in: high G+C Gram-positive bacteria) TaxID=84139 RepID=UPI00169718B5|nr:nitrite reductase small subunit NirD [Gordonia sp. (in: high G+C Gram-positive bacteria)]NLG45829.1 nitrite reductase small subunit NirD [Gordonia sp. (in: high G+C Gram-positive bacteria)]
MNNYFDLHRWTRDWTEACHFDRLDRLRGVAVLLPDGAQVALFRLADDSLRAVGNIDPISRAAVMSRGIVGDRNGFPVVASPLKKQAFSLIDGRCLDADGVRIPVYGTRVGLDGTVFVANAPNIRFGFRPAGFNADTVSEVRTVDRVAP